MDTFDNAEEQAPRFGTVRPASFATVQTSPSIVPEFLEVDDVVESVFRGQYVPWIVREVETFWDDAGLGVRAQRQRVVASHPGRGGVRFTWHGDRAISRYGSGYSAPAYAKYFFAYRPEKDDKPAEPNTASPEVLPLDIWRYKNGSDYRVLFVTNTSHKSEKHPPGVVYEALRDPTAKWSRPLSAWHRVFTLQSRKT